MNLEDLKSAWQTTDQHLPATQHVQQQLVHTLVQQRSRGRLAQLRRQLTGQALLLLAVGLLLLAVILGWNPFGLTTWYGFAPLVLWAGCVLLAALLTWQERQRVAQRTLADPDLRAALTFILQAQQRYLRLLGTLGWLAVLLIFVANLARTNEHLAELSKLETLGIYVMSLALAGLFTRWYWRKQWPKVSGSYSAELQTWLTELDELARP
jgi:hypothetical protein